MRILICTKIYKAGKLVPGEKWCLTNTDSWKIQQILRIIIVGKISEL